MNTQTISVQDIYNEVARVLRALFPNLKRVYQERIKAIDTPAMSVELISYKTPQFSEKIINKKVDLDIIYFSSSNGHKEALEVLDLLTSAFSMGLKVSKRDNEGRIVNNRFVHVLDTPEHKLIDQDLHFLISFEYQDPLEVIYVTEPDADNPYGIPTNIRDSSIEDKSIRFNDDDEYYKYLKDEYQLMQDLALDMEELKVKFKI